MWQDALERVDAFTKTHRGKRIYGWRKETIERSFAEAKENHGLHYARMLGIRNMREQCFLTAAVQNIKRLVASFPHVLIFLAPAFTHKRRGLSVGCAAQTGGFFMAGGNREKWRLYAVLFFRY